MGGVSVATVEKDDDVLKFKGTLSLENNGGFAAFQGWMGTQCSCYNSLRYEAKTPNTNRNFKG